MPVRPFIVVDRRDNVATALRPLTAGEVQEIGPTATGASGAGAHPGNPAATSEAGTDSIAAPLRLAEDIPLGHKFALMPIAAGDPVVKYGTTVGLASQDIAPGEHVHIHNVEGIKGRGDKAQKVPTATLSSRTKLPTMAGVGATPIVHATDEQPSIASPTGTFLGYLRAGGGVGIRNHVLVFPTVVCAATVAQMISRSMPGTMSVSHPHGCGHLGDDWEHMLRAMTGFCTNPNVGGVLLVGLGCEQITTDVLAARLRDAGQRFEVMHIQDEGGTSAAVAKGQELAEALLRAAATDQRTPVDISRLTVGMKCGGSDTLSGLTANPAAGVAADLLVAAGGRVIITEVPEMIGAEEVLASRAGDEKVRNRIYEVVADMERSILATGVDVRGSEPSPGNMEGGLTTLEEKSLGAIRKGGSSPVRQVTAYAEKPREKGLIVMDGPALDAVSVTGMLAAGAQLVVFTTGRGTPLGSAIAPVIKVASNSDVYRRMTDNIDLDAGQILEADVSLAEMGERILDTILEVASGRPTRSELLGHHEFAIHSVGPAV